MHHTSDNSVTALMDYHTFIILTPCIHMCELTKQREMSIAAIYVLYGVRETRDLLTRDYIG